MKVKLVIAYDGSTFSGWQSQPCGNTIQDHLSKASAKICGVPLSFQGSGRTDAGVHALGQTAHFEVSEGSSMQAPQWLAALNVHLPQQIRVLKAEEVHSDFHAQYSATGKTYRYQICHAPIMPPQLANRAWHLYGGLDLALIDQAAQLIVGTHDFARFSATRGKNKHGQNQDPEDTRRTISDLKISRQFQPQLAGVHTIDLTFTGNGFLYKMVRMLTGALVLCGQQKMTPAILQEMLERPVGSKCSLSAPAEGLTLVSVHYPQEDS